MFKEQLDQLIEFATQSRYSNDIYEARKEYQRVAGEIFEDDKAYETRMGVFLEWYIFDRPIPGTHQTPLEKLIAENGNHWSPEKLDACREFSRSIHALFTPKKVRDHSIQVLNLLNNQKYEIQENEARLIFRKDDIFEGRILPYQGTYYFSGNFCFHPREAKKFILGEAKKIIAEQKGYQKELKTVDRALASLRKKQGKNDQAIARLKSKIEKASSEKKTESLKTQLAQLEDTRARLDRETWNLETQKTDLEDQKLKIQYRETCNRLMQRLAYMNLKWERSRQIDLRDIYRN